LINQEIEAGPNSVLAFKREGCSHWDVDFRELMETLTYAGFRKIAIKYWQDRLGELHRFYSKTAFIKALQHLIPEVSESDLKRGRAGVRAMACDDKGNLIYNYLFTETPAIIIVCNAPYPAAIAQKILTKVA